MSATAVFERARARNPLPPGTVAVGAGLLVAGLTIYAFLAIAARGLGPREYAPLSVLWSITFLAAPGFYFPLEQEVGRALSDRRARGLGGGPVVLRAALLGGAFVLALSVAAVGASPVLLGEFFDDQVMLMGAFVLALAAYALQFLVRGTLAGNGRFTPYGVLVGAEGALRLAGGVVLALAGVAVAGPYGLVVALSPIAAVLLVLAQQHNLLTPGPRAPWSELSRALGYLLVGSVLAQAMINVTPLVVNVLAPEGEKELVGKMLIALIVARIPVFMFQAVQASLIPQLAALAAKRRVREFRIALLRLTATVVTIAGAFSAGAMALGPTVVRVFFGREFELGWTHMGYLSGASGLFMLALAFGQALIAVTSYRRAALSWTVGMATLFLVTAAPGSVLFRAERGFLAGAAAAAVVMGFMLARRIARGLVPESEPLLEFAPAPEPA